MLRRLTLGAFYTRFSTVTYSFASPRRYRTMSDVLPLSEIPTLSLLYKLHHISPEDYSEGGNYAPNATYNDKVSVIRQDITTLAVDAIVNAANKSLLGGGGVDGAIHRAAGPDLLDECETLGGCETGSAKITNGYELPAKKVIHAVGPIYWATREEGTHAELLSGCYRTSLELAVANDCKSIAFSALSTGVYGYPSGEASKVALQTVRKFFDEGKGDKLDRVVFCNFLQKDEDAYFRHMPKYFPPVAAEEKTEESAKAEEAEKSDEVKEEDTVKREETGKTADAQLTNDAASDLAAQLPNPPTANPSNPEEPSTKKRKTEETKTEDTETDDEYVVIEREEANEASATTTKAEL